MNWITIIWSMMAAACLILAGIHFTLWSRYREAQSSLFFSFAALAAAIVIFLELALIHSQNVEDYKELLTWQHVFLAALLIALAWFVDRLLETGRSWLAWLITAINLLVIVVSFVAYPNLIFQDITRLRHVSFLGETFSMPQGQANSWHWLVLFSVLVLLIYIVDATISAWKRDRRQRALVIGGAASIAIAGLLISANLMSVGIFPIYFAGANFLVIVLAMFFEQSVNLARSRSLGEDLRRIENRMSMAANAAELGMWEWDVVRDQIWVNKTARKRLGVDNSEYTATTFESFLQFVHPDDRESFRSAMQQAIEGGEKLEIKIRVCQDGGTRWRLVHGQVRRDSNGRAVNFSGVSLDITNRLEHEEALRESAELRRELAHVQRTSALGQLSSALAHEINQPLGAILRNIEAAELYLKQTPPNLEELQEIFQDIRSDEQRAARVIDRMRSLIMRRELNFELISVKELLAQIEALMHSELQAQEAALFIEIPAELPQVNGDRIHLQQVILNLILNSLDAMGSLSKTEKRIVIRASQTVDNMVKIALSDNGPGFKPGLIATAFKPFHTTKSKGMGIGLAISKTIVGMHGGEISVENNPDDGATVWFTLKPAERED